MYRPQKPLLFWPKIRTKIFHLEIAWIALNKHKWIVYNKNCDRYAIGVQQTQLECEVAMNTLLGQRIREQRKEKGWTIEQFAERRFVDKLCWRLRARSKNPQTGNLYPNRRGVGCICRCAYSGFRCICFPCGRWRTEQKAESAYTGQKKAAIDILNAYTDNIPYIIK